MAEELTLQTAIGATNGNTISCSDQDPGDSALTWNYIWDEKLCKTTLKLIKPTVYTPPVLSLTDVTDPQAKYVCPVEGCNKSFAKERHYIFRTHLKRHLPDSQKPFKCNEPGCRRAFVRYSELDTHNLIHTGERPYECEQCGKKFTRTNHLTKHFDTHSKGKKINKAKASSTDCDDSEASDSYYDDSSSSSIVASDLDVSIKQEIDTEIDTDAGTERETNEDDQRDEKEEIKVEPTKMIAPSCTAFYSSSSDLPVDTNGTQIKEPNIAEDFRFNNALSNSLVPTNLEASVKQEINTEASMYFDPVQLGVPLKQEITTETTDEYGRRIEGHNRCEIENIKQETEIIVEPYYPNFYASHEPMSMSDAIHSLAFSTPIAPNNIKTELESTNNFYSESLSPTVVHNINSESMSSKVMEPGSKCVEKPYKCAVEGCDRAFKVPYGLKRHSWVHTKVKTFECDQCKKRFLRKDHLSKHIKSHIRIQKPSS